MKSLIILIVLIFHSFLFANNFSVDLQLETRLFNEKGLLDQDQVQLSGAIDPAYEVSFNSEKDQFKIKLFARYDSLDDERSHFDIRQFDWLKVFDSFEFRLGVSKVFWGVTETAHLVDIINQTDFVEDFDGEDKLGQPMLNLIKQSDYGTFEAYLLPYFRERTFASTDGRLGFPVKVGKATYKSDKEEENIDFALRWSQSISDYDIGLSYFNGTSREPQYVLLPGMIIPYYDQIEQFGLDLQVTLTSTLLKLEAIHRTWRPDNYFALVVGQEHTFSNIFETNYDLGFLTEYHYDERKEGALTPFEDDIFLGFRLAFNDPSDSQLLAGLTLDLTKDSQFLSVEAQRQIGDHFILNIKHRSFLKVDKKDRFVNYCSNESYTLLNLLASF